MRQGVRIPAAVHSAEASSPPAPHSLYFFPLTFRVMYECSVPRYALFSVSKEIDLLLIATAAGASSLIYVDFLTYYRKRFGSLCSSPLQPYKQPYILSITRHLFT
jgi:hypothetical protein